LRHGDRGGHEKEDVKREIFKKLVPMLNSAALIASNTSSISITRLAAATDRPGKFIGMHFMNPVPVMNLVELIRGIATDEETFAAARDLALKLARRRSRRGLSGLYGQRILLPMINEAVYALYEGVGSVEAIDTAMKLGATTDGAAGAGRFHRARHLPLDHAGAL